MGLQPTVNYTRERLVGNGVLPKLRELSNGELQHWTDRDLGNILDMAVKARIEQAEMWWEDDFAFGICLNKVVRVDEDLPAVKLPEIYAIVRPCANVDAYGREEIIVTVINQKNYDLSIESGRWTEQRPEKSRYRHPGDEEEMEEEVAEWDETGYEEPGKLKGLLLSYVTGEGTERKAQYQHVTEDKLQVTVLKLLGEGADPSTIFVWTNQSRVRLNIQLEEMK